MSSAIAPVKTADPVPSRARAMTLRIGTLYSPSLTTMPIPEPCASSIETFSLVPSSAAVRLRLSNW